MTDEHRNAITLSEWRDGQNSQLKRTIKELSQFENKKPEELESEFGHSDAANSCPTSPFKGRNMVDSDFVYKQLLDGHKPCNATLSLTQYQRERLIGLKSILYLCNDGQNKHLRC